MKTKLNILLILTLLVSPYTAKGQGAGPAADSSGSSSPSVGEMWMKAHSARFNTGMGPSLGGGLSADSSHSIGLGLPGLGQQHQVPLLQGSQGFQIPAHMRTLDPIAPYDFSSNIDFGSLDLLQSQPLRMRNGTSRWWEQDVSLLLRPTEPSSDAQDFEHDGLFSCEADHPAFDREINELANQTDIQSCFDKRLDYSRNPDAEGEVLLASEMEACECLRDKPISRDIMNQTLAANELIRNQSLRNRIEETVHVRAQNALTNELSSTLNGILAYTAVVLNKREEEAQAQAISYSANVFKSHEHGPESLRALDVSYTPDISVLQDEWPLSGNQCLTKEEYFRMMMIPSGSDLTNIRADLTKGPEHWNFNQLDSRYRDLMKLDPEVRLRDHLAEIESLKSKLKFLNRNPLIKFYLGSDSSSATLLKKRELLGHMLHLNDEDCKEIISSCSEEFHGALENFFGQEDAKAVVREAAGDFITERVKNEAADDFLSGDEDLLQDGKYNQELVIDRFTENFNLPNPDYCRRDPNRPMDGTIAKECLQTYSAYCKTIDRVEELHESNRGVDPRVADDLDETIKNDFNSDFASNPNFQKLNDEQCGPRSTRGGITGFIRDRVNFEEFRSDECKDGNTIACNVSSYSDLVNLRQKFYSNYPQSRGDSVEEPPKSLSSGAMLRKPGSPRYFTPERPTFDSVNSMIARSSVKMKANLYSNTEGAETGKSNNTASDMDQTDPIMNYSNYSNVPGLTDPNETNVAKAEPQRIQEMSHQSRQELLNEWEEEYANWKESKGENLNGKDSAAEEQMRREIASLRALLAQQQQITNQQYQLLNDAIATRRAEAEENNNASEAPQRSSANSSARNIAAARSGDEEASRGPASVNENAFNTAGSSGSASGAGSASTRTAGGVGGASVSSSSSSSDSVAREEAKLVNMRRFSDGTITIENATNNSGSIGNAISVPVSIEQYRILQTNPGGLNLSQIEQRIPAEHIARLERNGEIILLLRHGENPPFEVKVQKRDNRLVYSVQDNSGRAPTAVRRVFRHEQMVDTAKLLMNHAE